MSDETAAPPEKYPFAFRAAVVRELEAHGLGIKEWRDGGVDLEREDGAEHFVPLFDLFRQVSAAPPEAAEGLVRQFFQPPQSQPAQNEPPAELADMPRTMEEAAERLLVRVGRPFEEDERAPWAMPVPGAPDLSLSLVIDFPTMMAFVSPEMLAKSDTAAGDWVLRGLENLMRATPDGWFRLIHENEGIWAGNAGDSYDAARALVLCELTQSDDLGWLVTIPTRDWVFARKVDEEGLKFFHLLKLIAQSAISEQPHPISDEVYWVRPGQPWERIPIEIEGDQVKVYPPQAFAEALNLEVEETPGEPSSPRPPGAGD